MDANLLIWIQEHLRFDALTPVVAFISMLGDSGLIWIVIALLFLFFAQLRRAGLMTLVSLAGSVLVVNVVLKHL
ncbi:MAG: phosphatase PAP2 family protein, partial [Coriobacteriia bacterium]|nr:phosphatase PAP2 family protein [Coriobacteriia bacterium]